MAKKQISIRVEEDLLEALDTLMISNGAALTYKVEALIKMSMLNYNDALRSLVGRFTYLETCYIVQAFNGTIIERDLLSTTRYLHMMVKDFYKYGSMGFYSNEDVNVENLLNKLKDLSDYQALVVINTIEEFWNDSDKDINDLLIVEKVVENENN